MSARNLIVSLELGRQRIPTLHQQARFLRVDGPTKHAPALLPTLARCRGVEFRVHHAEYRTPSRFVENVDDSLPQLSVRINVQPRQTDVRNRVILRSHPIWSFLHSLANRVATMLMKLLFGCVAHVHVLRRENANRNGAFLLAANHISHFDPPIIVTVVRRKIDWMAMAELFPRPLVGSILRAVDAFPANRYHADRSQIRAAIDRLGRGRIVGLFPEGGIRDGAGSVLGGAPLRPGAIKLAHIARVPILPCVIVGSDRFYGRKSWRLLRRTPVWIAFGDPIPYFPNLEKSVARETAREALAVAFEHLYAELREKFSLTADDLPHPPAHRMKND